MGARRRRSPGRHVAPPAPRVVPGGAPGLLLGVVALALGTAAVLPAATVARAETPTSTPSHRPSEDAS